MSHEASPTYRLQLRPGFGFKEAEKLIDYFTDLGIGYLYTSPYLQAAAGSTHGYDIVDPSRVNRELGGREAHSRLCKALRKAGLDHMIDVVPNHMAIPGKQNPWWWDVLENGPSSRFATYFDVDWEASEDRWLNKVLLPVLGDHYGRILEDGQLQLMHDRGIFTLHYHEHVFPVDPSSLVGLLSRAAEACGSEELAFLAESHARLPRPTVTASQAVERRHRDKAVLLDLLARLCRENPEVIEAIDAEVAMLNANPDALDFLIDDQNYRLSFWRTASRDLGYRRFFDIKDLAGLRVEDMEVFRATHALPIVWVKKGWVQGLRIDHPDGLRDPGEYFHRLREACPEVWIVAEKILMPDEKLPSHWPIAGTTGYEFLNLAQGLFVDFNNEAALTQIYEKFIDSQIELEELFRTSKRLVLTELLGSELNRLTSLFINICERHRRYRDYTRHELQEALRGTAVCFPVYRSYMVNADSKHRRTDLAYIDQAIDNAREERPDLDPELFAFLRELLLLRIDGDLEHELAVRFQQLTSAAMAKGIEDTSLYRYHRLTALNEVGADLMVFGIGIAKFHEKCIENQTDRPHMLLASTTHDTKRSEDVRARLMLLSEIPERWADAVENWATHNAGYKTDGIPDHNTEYLLYQTLVGAWPIEPERITAYMEKAVREAKVHTSWRNQDDNFENGLRDFIEAILADDDFVAEFEHFVKDIILPGRINSMALTLIKLTAPGIPDIYQGTELWDLSLVDPDNRRPVDFDMRRKLLSEAARLSPSDIIGRMDDGLPKMWVIRQALHLRREHPELFGSDAAYRPIVANGAKADHVVAFARADRVITVVPRLVMSVAGNWGDTAIELLEGGWENILTGERVNGPRVPVAKLLGHFPVALLVQRES